ncbi:hypothetical protein ACFL6E_02350 [Candidatus Neomarinimicrobiota bacterium]
MERRHFYTCQIDLLQDISARTGDTAYSYLKDEQPESIANIPLVQVGVWLQMDEPAILFVKEQFILAIEKRIKKLGNYEWMRFNAEVTGFPDVINITGDQRRMIISVIENHINVQNRENEDQSGDPRDRLREILFSPKAQRQMCANLNEAILLQAKNWLSKHELDNQNPIRIANYQYYESMVDLLEGWFAEHDLAVLGSGSLRHKKSKVRTIDQFPHLQTLKNLAFPKLLKELYKEYQLPLKKIFNSDFELAEEEKSYLLRSFSHAAIKNMPITMKKSFKVRRPKTTEDTKIVLEPRK